MLTCRVENCGDCGIVWFRKEISVQNALSSQTTKYDHREHAVSARGSLEGIVWTSSMLIKNTTQIDVSSQHLCVVFWRNLTLELSFNLTLLYTDTWKAPYIDKSLSYIFFESCFEYCVLHCPLIMMEGQSDDSVVEWTYNGNEWNVSLSANIGEYSTTIRDVGAYICRASNNYGSDAIEIFIDIHGKFQLGFLHQLCTAKFRAYTCSQNQSITSISMYCNHSYICLY